MRFWLCLPIILASVTLFAADKSPSSVGKKQADFELNDFRGQPWKSSDVAGKPLVVAFLGCDCPLMQLYGPKLQELSQRLGDKVAFVAVNSNQQDTPTKIGHFARKSGIEFPLLKDPANKLADQFGAERTPEVFLLDADRVVRYHGRIDDHHLVGVSRPKPNREDLVIAIDELLAGKEIATKETEAVGCLIGKVLRPKPDGDVTYTKDIAPILNQHCVRCHRPGEIGPFALTNYAEVVGWAEMMAEVVEQQRMPPWHANPKHGDFRNDARLSDKEKQTLYRWVDNGAPEGDAKDLPAPPTFAEGWQMGEPDQIVYMQEQPFNVPATGEVKYRYFVADPGFKEDKWIQAAECRPGNRAVVHHIIVLAKDGKQLGRGGDFDSGWLCATAPGARPLILPPGSAKKVPAGSRLVFQMHYTPNGKATTDRSCIGLKFADPKTVRKEVITEKSATPSFRIPPGAEHFKVEATHTFREDSVVLSMFPHMHLRGAAFRYTAILPNGEKNVLLDIPRYDFNWQNGYEFAEPVKMPAGSKMYCEAWYDNSKHNPANPDPSATVRWGDQTWEEMMIGYFDMSLANQDLLKESVRRTDEFVWNFGKDAPPVSDEAKRLAAKALTSDEAFAKLGLELKKTAPQLDRMCWTTIENQKLEVKRCVQPPELERVVGGKAKGLPAALSKIARYVDRSGVVVINELANESGVDVQHMAQKFKAGVFIPVEIDGVKGTLNFWSTEADAFPPAAVKYLETAAAGVKK